MGGTEYILLLCLFSLSVADSVAPSRHLSSCGTGLATDPNDFSSWAAMTAGGWSCIHCSNVITHTSADPGHCAATPANTFCGYTESSSSGNRFELQMVLSGAGVLSLDYSTLKADTWRETKVYLNGNFRGELDEGDRETLNINFVDGDVLGIRQGHSSVVMNVHSITFACEETTTTRSTSTTATATTSSSTATTSSSTATISSTSTATSSSTSSSESTSSSTTDSTTRSSTTTRSSSTTRSSTITRSSSSISSTSSFTTTSSSTSGSTTSSSSTSSFTTSSSSTTSLSTTSSMTTSSRSETETSTTRPPNTTTVTTSSSYTTTRTATAISTSTTSHQAGADDLGQALQESEVSAVQDLLGQLDLSNLQGDGVLASQRVENELGATLVAVVSGTSSADVVTDSGASVTVDAAVMQQLGGQPLVISFTSFSDSSMQQLETATDLAGAPVSISLWALDSSPVRLTNAVVPLQIQIPTNNSNAQCVFWNESSSEWSSAGLRWVSYQDGMLTCESTHLTIFSALFQQLAIALRCSTAPALLSAEGLSAFGRFPNWLGYASSLIVVLSIFFFALCMASAVGSDRSAQQVKEELVFMVNPPAQSSKCCAPVLRASAVLGMDDTLRDVMSLRDRKAFYEAFVSRCIRMLHSHKAGACWDSLRLVMVESSASRALMKSQSFFHRTKRRFNKAFSKVFNSRQKVHPEPEKVTEKEESHGPWHEKGGVKIVEGFLAGSWSSRVWSLAPAVHPWLRAVQSSLFSSHASRTMLMYLKLATAGAINALFYQGSSLSIDTESEECREPDTPFLQAMRAFAIGVTSALVGDLLILILWKVQKRPSLLSEPWTEDAEEIALRRWRRRLRGFWCVSLGHCCFCLFYTFAFLANVSEEDSGKWLQATLVSLLEDLLLLPVTLAVGFGSFASLLLFFRPDVKADIRARWIDDDSGTISQMVLFKPSKKTRYALEDDVEAAPCNPPSTSENIRVESMGPSQSQGAYFGVTPASRGASAPGGGCEAKAVASEPLELS